MPDVQSTHSNPYVANASYASIVKSNETKKSEAQQEYDENLENAVRQRKLYFSLLDKRHKLQNKMRAFEEIYGKPSLLSGSKWFEFQKMKKQSNSLWNQAFDADCEHSLCLWRCDSANDSIRDCNHNLALANSIFTR